MTVNWEYSNQYRNSCSLCRRFISMSKRYGWEASGEFGEDTKYICSKCLDDGAIPQASNGSSDPRWCGVVNK